MRTVLWTLSVLMLTASVASAQDYDRYGRGGWGGGYGGGYDHASTAYEGAARGWADIIRADGYQNLLNSKASINWSVARKNEIANRKFGTETYFQMRAINKQARAAERGPRPSMEALIRLSQSGAPKLLSPTEFDPLSGAINWPPILLGDEYEADRANLEQIYGERANNGFLKGDQLAAIRGLMDNLEAKLKQNVREYPPQSYAQAKNFLNSLKYESLKPAR